ncbi:MAG: RDD family protein, partial [Chloroflexi bacterium]
MTLERDLHIRTAEHVGISYELAGIGNRMLAAFFDILFLGIVIVGGFLVAAVILRQLGVSLAVDFIVSAVLVVLLLLVVPFGYWVAMESLWNGQTLGKRIVGIRVLRDDGSPVGFFAIATRALLRSLDLVPIIFPIDIVLIVASKKGQRLGDIVAGTVVVKARVERDFSTLRTRAVPQGEAPVVTVRGLSGEGQRLVREFALREGGLKPEARTEVARAIARTIRPAIPESAAHPDDVEFLRAVAASLR